MLANGIVLSSRHPDTVSVFRARRWLAPALAIGVLLTAVPTQSIQAAELNLGTVRIESQLSASADGVAAALDSEGTELALFSENVLLQAYRITPESGYLIGSGVYSEISMPYAVLYQSIAITPDGLEMYAHEQGLRRFSRPCASCQWSPDHEEIESPRFGNGVYPHWVSPDSLRLYFTGSRAGDPYMRGSDVFVTSRDSTSDAFDFEVATSLTLLNSLAGEEDVAFSADERVAFVSTRRRGSAGNRDIWYATRDSISDQFSPLSPIDLLNGIGPESDLTVVGDRLYFSSAGDIHSIAFSLSDSSELTSLPEPGAMALVAAILFGAAVTRPRQCVRTTRPCFGPCALLCFGVATGLPGISHALTLSRVGTLEPEGLEQQYRFGSALFAEGGLAYVGSLVGGEEPRVRIYDIETQSEISRIFATPHYEGGNFGFRLAVHGDEVFLTAPGVPAVMAFNAQSGDFNRTIYSDGVASSDAYGEGLAVSEELLVVGTRYGEVSGTRGNGRVHVHARESGVELYSLTGSGSREVDNYGFRADLGDGKLVVAAPYDDVAGLNAGSVYVYDAATGGLLYRLFGDPLHFNRTSEGVQISTVYGIDTAVDEGILAIKARSELTLDGEQTSAVYVYDLETGAKLSRIDLGQRDSNSNWDPHIALDDGILFVGSRDTADGSGALDLLDAYSGELLATIQSDSPRREDLFGAFKHASDGTLLVTVPDGTSGRNTVGVYQYSRLEGDYNFDGSVDAADYTAWRDAVGTAGNHPIGDGDLDSYVDGDDYLVWAAAYGSGGSSPADSVIPEPSAIVLAVVTLGWNARRSHKPQRSQ